MDGPVSLNVASSPNEDARDLWALMLMTALCRNHNQRERAPSITICRGSIPRFQARRGEKEAWADRDMASSGVLQFMADAEFVTADVQGFLLHNAISGEFVNA
jgi:hypothetical protein